MIYKIQVARIREKSGEFIPVDQWKYKELSASFSFHNRDVAEQTRIELMKLSINDYISIKEINEES